MKSTRGLAIGGAEALLVAATEAETGYDRGAVLESLLPAAVLIDLAAAGVVGVDSSGSTSIGGSPDAAAPAYVHEASALGHDLSGRVDEVMWRLRSTLRPLPATVAAALVAEGRLEVVDNRVARMQVGHRFPALDVAFFEAVERGVRDALEMGSAEGPMGRAALVLAAAGVVPQVLPGASPERMTEALAGSAFDRAGLGPDIGPVLQQVAVSLQTTILR